MISGIFSVLGGEYDKVAYHQCQHFKNDERTEAH